MTEILVAASAMLVTRRTSARNTTVHAKRDAKTVITGLADVKLDN